jgi:23S rRNA (uridine2552-2'-O)-methyltransferase
MKIAAPRGASNPAREVTPPKLWITLQHSRSCRVIRTYRKTTNVRRTRSFCCAGAARLAMVENDPPQSLLSLQSMAKYEPHDSFYRKARERGLPSRAAFKIEELLARFRLVRPGARVVDLGCAPGGWLSMLAAAVGAQGRVVGIDLVACPAGAANVATITADIRDLAKNLASVAAVTAALGGPADLVTSDLAPKLSGVAERDQARMLELALAALECSRVLLRPGGAMVVKLFMGGDCDQAVAAFARDFAQVERTRTRASRPGSSELYLVARGFRAAAARTSGPVETRGPVG